MSDIEFAGEKFAMADKVGLLPLMRFAKVANSGVDSNNMDGLVAMYDLLEQCIAPTDWARFQAAADKERAGGDMLMSVVSEVFAALAERPTSRPSDSSDGPTITEPNSGDASYLRVVHRLEGQGRPDLALMATMAEEGRSAISA